MANIRTHYDNLKVARNAPDSVIKAAYKALCQTYHPDKFQGSNAEAERIMKLINTSYTVLIDPVKRAEHDAWIRAQEAEVNQPREKATFGETGNGTEQEFYQKQETKWKYTPPPTDPEPPAQKQTSTNWGAWVFGIGTVSFFAFIGFGLKPESMPTTNTAPVTVTSVPAQNVTQPSVTGRSPLDSLLEDSKTPQAVTGSTSCIGDCINGQGTLTYTVGDKYVGQFKNGQPDGQGALIYVSGDKYVGEFKNNTVSGQGVATYVNGLCT
jgi:curved DNA-binding protein CbpA